MTLAVTKYVVALKRLALVRNLIAVQLDLLIRPSGLCDDGDELRYFVALRVIDEVFFLEACNLTDLLTGQEYLLV